MLIWWKQGGHLHSHLIFHINEWTHVKLLGESHAVIKLDAMHSGVVEVKPLQLECQQVGKVQKSQTLWREAFIEESGRSTTKLSLHLTSTWHHVSHCAHLPRVTFLFAAFAEVLVGPIQSFWLDKGLQRLFLWQKKVTAGPFRRKEKH